MPPLKQDTTGLASYQRVRFLPENPFDTPYKSATELSALRPWHTINFGGQPLIDFFNAQAIETAIRLINADSSHAGGVRIRFRAGTTYTNLVKVLDIMNYTNQRKYWLDNRHQQAVLYAITDKELPKYPRPVMMSGCVLPLDETLTPSTLLAWQRFLAEYWLPVWRLPWLLLVALGALGIRKLVGTAKS